MQGMRKESQLQQQPRARCPRRPTLRSGRSTLQCQACRRPHQQVAPARHSRLRPGQRGASREHSCQKDGS